MQRSAPHRARRRVGSSVHVGYEPQRVELRRPEFDLVELLLIRVSSHVGLETHSYPFKLGVQVS